MQAIAVLDQPSLRGRASLRLNPSLMSVEELARRLSELLTAQGYSVSTSATQAAPVLLFPVSTLNALFVFAVDPRMLDYVSKWADELESRASGGSGPGYVSYQVKNTDAQGLAKVLQDLLSTPAGIQQGMQQGGATAAAAAIGARRVVVNPTTNTLIVAGAGIDRAQVLGLMRDLDRPARAVLIEVMVAEVRLTGGLTLGVEFAFQDTRSGGSIVGGTLGNLGIGRLRPRRQLLQRGRRASGQAERARHRQPRAHPVDAEHRRAERGDGERAGRRRGPDRDQQPDDGVVRFGRRRARSPRARCRRFSTATPA